MKTLLIALCFAGISLPAPAQEYSRTATQDFCESQFPDDEPRKRECIRNEFQAFQTWKEFLKTTRAAGNGGPMLRFSDCDSVAKATGWQLALKCRRQIVFIMSDIREFGTDLPREVRNLIQIECKNTFKGELRKRLACLEGRATEYQSR